MSGFIEKCPRCGSDEFSHGYSAPPLVFTASCHADGCDITAIGDTEEECMNNWNSGNWSYRVSEWDINGNPSEYEMNPNDR